MGKNVTQNYLQTENEDNIAEDGSKEMKETNNFKDENSEKNEMIIIHSLGNTNKKQRI